MCITRQNSVAEPHLFLMFIQKDKFSISRTSMYELKPEANLMNFVRNVNISQLARSKNGKKNSFPATENSRDRRTNRRTNVK